MRGKESQEDRGLPSRVICKSKKVIGSAIPVEISISTTGTIATGVKRKKNKKNKTIFPKIGSVTNVVTSISPGGSIAPSAKINVMLWEIIDKL